MNWAKPVPNGPEATKSRMSVQTMFAFPSDPYATPM
jgi:hypothetical protein